MSNFGICLSICLFFVSLWNFKAFHATDDIKHAILSFALIAAAFHCLYLANECDRKEGKNNDD